MNKFIEILGGGVLALSSVCAHAEISYFPDAVFDSESGLYWRLFETLEQGEAAGFSWASVDQTADLFLHYAPPDANGTLPGYDPDWGGILSYTTSGDGMSYSFTWESSYDYDNYLPPLLSDPLGYSISYGTPGPHSPMTDALLAQVSGDNQEAVTVLLRDVTQADQYGWIAGEVEGIIDPPSQSIDDCPCPFYDERTAAITMVDYYNDDGSLNIAGYLMVSSVPEPTPPALFLAGIAGIALRRKLTQVCAPRLGRGKGCGHARHACRTAGFRLGNARADLEVRLDASRSETRLSGSEWSRTSRSY
ncbi:hypothetical protein Tbd_1958 [Thiobacillus denitrificans ATCC 25259]|uniref:PEP-CTERM protein-sorting domain-containing protein n=1 Tax=Thiobacillus denitrificans (strain ATCC 25259 / T1) TaxID=292415 RepID=Q3SHH5_THIDA|nr:PEP-CTERM sorting domain-containing protein [Thiobacillus denitrificans]AAZ97911.1 hypothetical protein Tbd_1958 [Thiobacillus denitrificans ATCC 25259]